MTKNILELIEMTELSNTQFAALYGLQRSKVQFWINPEKNANPRPTALAILNRIIELDYKILQEKQPARKDILELLANALIAKEYNRTHYLEKRKSLSKKKEEENPVIAQYHMEIHQHFRVICDRLEETLTKYLYGINPDRQYSFGDLQSSLYDEEFWEKYQLSPVTKRNWRYDQKRPADDIVINTNRIRSLEDEYQCTLEELSTLLYRLQVYSEEIEMYDKKIPNTIRQFNILRKDIEKCTTTIKQNLSLFQTE